MRDFDFTAVTVAITVPWDVMLRSLVEIYSRFGETNSEGSSSSALVNLSYCRVVTSQNAVILPFIYLAISWGH
jgi:hypothetical protein